MARPDHGHHTAKLVNVQPSSRTAQPTTSPWLVEVQARLWPAMDSKVHGQHMASQSHGEPSQCPGNTMASPANGQPMASSCQSKPRTWPDKKTASSWPAQSKARPLSFQPTGSTDHGRSMESPYPARVQLMYRPSHGQPNICQAPPIASPAHGKPSPSSGHASLGHDQQSPCPAQSMAS
jgi:hypothetical protein